MGRIYFLIGLALLFLGARYILYFDNAPVIHDGEELSFQTTLLSDPKRGARSQRIFARNQNGERIFISTARFPEFSYGQTLLIEGVVRVVDLENGSLIYTMSYPEISVIAPRNPVVVLSSVIRAQISRVFSESLPFPSSSLLIGIVFGVKEGMPEGLFDALIKTGVIHITAASGMNITLLAGAVFMIFGTLLKRKAAILISICILWIYAVIAGFDASIVRASIMASIAFSASLLGRQNVGWYALALTVFVMLFLSPKTLYDVGFQLSAASTAGILFLVPLMQRGGKKQDDKELWFLGEDFKATTAAQAATIPILLSAFGSYGLLSIPVNLLVLWTIPFLMILGGIAAILSFLLPILATPVLYLSLPFLLWIQYVVTVASDISPAIHVETFPWSLAVGYYLFLLSLALYLYRRRREEK